MTDYIKYIPRINLQPVVTLTYMHLSNTQTMIGNFLHTDENRTQYVPWKLKGGSSLQDVFIFSLNILALFDVQFPVFYV